AAANRIQVVYAAVQATSGIHDKARLPHRAFGKDEGWNRVGGSVQRGQCDLRVRHWMCRAVESRTAPAHCRLSMALRATVAVKSRTQAHARLARNCSAHGKDDLELSQASIPEPGFIDVECWDWSTGARRASSGAGIDLCGDGARKQQRPRHDETTEKRLQA